VLSRQREALRTQAQLHHHALTSTITIRHSHTKPLGSFKRARHRCSRRELATTVASYKSGEARRSRHSQHHDTTQLCLTSTPFTSTALTAVVQLA
jgi:hypothetical protein